MKAVRMLAIFNLLSVVAHAGFAYAIQFRLIDRAAVSEISNRHPSLLVPASNTFAIWGVIYTTLFIFCIYHLVLSFARPIQHPANDDTRRMGIWFILVNFASIAWLFTWTDNNLQWATILIVAQFIILMIIHLRLGLHDPYATQPSKMFTSLPLSIYFGWIMFAAIANISVYLVSINWNGFGWGYSPVTWAQLMLGLVVFITIVIVLVQRNVFFGLVILWGLHGIIRQRESVDAEEYSPVIQASWIGIGVISITCLIQLVNNLSKKRRTEKFLISRKVRKTESPDPDSYRDRKNIHLGGNAFKE